MKVAIGSDSVCWFHSSTQSVLVNFSQQLIIFSLVCFLCLELQWYYVISINICEYMILANVSSEILSFSCRSRFCFIPLTIWHNYNWGQSLGSCFTMKSYKHLIFCAQIVLHQNLEINKSYSDWYDIHNQLKLLYMLVRIHPGVAPCF